MTYQVLARKWRPRNFSEVIGQGHVLKALINALDGDRLHHAYLFTGTRGVGKTTLARAFAKALNCEQGVSSKPCGTCSACVEIDEGRFVDLIEVDAASRTKVDETRDLLDNVQYAPSRGRYKVYLIDEVHMFSNHSFNALLKTLEEPPPHVKFLLATTDPKKLPVTILSRCLQFNLTRLGVAQLTAHLAGVLDQEGVAYDAEAVELVAQAAAGSVRDALSLLDQAIAHGAGRVEAAEVAAMLGTVDRDRVLKLLETLAGGDPAALVAQARELSEYAPDYAQVLAELLSLLRRIAVAQALGDGAADVEADGRLLELAASLSPETCQLYYQIALTGRRDLAISPDAEAGFEMALLRMLAFRPAEVDVAAAPGGAGRPVARPAGRTADPAAPLVTAPAAKPAAGRKAGRRSPAAREPASGAAPRPASVRPSPIVEADAETPPESVPPAAPAAPETPAAESAPAESRPAAAPGRAPAGETPREWARLVDELEIVGLVRELARNSALAARREDVFELVIAPNFEKLAARRYVEALQTALGARIGRDARINVTVAADATLQTPSEQDVAAAAERQRRAEVDMDSDPNVQALREAFDATIEDVSARPRG